MEKSLTDAIAHRAWELDGKPSMDTQVYRDWTETVVAAASELGWTFVPPVREQVAS
jgi:hypothetical protein